MWKDPSYVISFVNVEFYGVKTFRDDQSMNHPVFVILDIRSDSISYAHRAVCPRYAGRLFRCIVNFVNMRFLRLICGGTY